MSRPARARPFGRRTTSSGTSTAPGCDSAEIPADLPIAGGFVDLILAAERDAAEILRDAATRAAAGEAAPGSNQQKLGDIFASFMDEDRVEELGAEPLRRGPRRDRRRRRHERGCVRLLGRFERTGVSGFVGVHVDTDDKDSDRSVVKVSQGGLGLPDESYYRDDTFAEIREQVRRARGRDARARWGHT